MVRFFFLLMIISSQTAWSQPSQVQTRRSFLACSLAFSGAALVNTGLSIAVDVVTKPDGTPYVQTMTESQLLRLGKLLVEAIAPFATGNAGDEQWKKQNPQAAASLSDYLYGSFYGPATEEFLFRGLPAELFGKSWLVGATTSIIFAAAHNQTDDGFDLTKVPISQFMGGIYYWYLVRERGLDHSIIAHIGNNHVGRLSDKLLEAFPARP